MSNTLETPTLPSTVLSRLTDGYGIKLDPIGARLADYALTPEHRARYATARFKEVTDG